MSFSIEHLRRIRAGDILYTSTGKTLLCMEVPVIPGDEFITKDHVVVFKVVELGPEPLRLDRVVRVPSNAVTGFSPLYIRPGTNICSPVENAPVHRYDSGSEFSLSSPNGLIRVAVTGPIEARSPITMSLEIVEMKPVLPEPVVEDIEAPKDLPVIRPPANDEKSKKKLKKKLKKKSKKKLKRYLTEEELGKISARVIQATLSVTEKDLG